MTVRAINASVYPVSWQRSQTVQLEVSSSASPDRLFALLADAEDWPRWFGLTREVQWWRDGRRGGPGGVGAVRRVSIGPFAVRETVLEETAPTHHAYSIRAPGVRQHRGEVRLRPTDAGSALSWTITFRALVPGTGPLLRAGMGVGLRRLVGDLVSAAEKG